MSIINSIASKFGYTKYSEILDMVPAHKWQEAVDKLKEMYNTDLYQDPIAVSKKIGEIKALSNGLDDHLNERIDRINKGFPVTSVSNALLGYEAAGSQLRRLYPNPFAPYSFIGNNHWATFRARAAFREDAFRDGFVFRAPEGVSKKKLKLVQTAFDDLNMWQYMLEMMDHVNTFGNCWIDRKTNLLGGLKEFSILLPEKIVPIMDSFGDFIIGWQYEICNREIIFDLKDLDLIKTYNLRSMQLGSPPLAGVLTDVEADMYASIYANMIFQKGGLIRAIVSLGTSQDGFQDPSSLNPNNGLDFAMKVWELFTRTQGGLRGAAALTFLPDVQNVFPITSPKDLEGPYKETSDRTCIKVCNLLGISPRRLSCLSGSQYVNKAAIEDEESLDTLNHRAYITDLVFQYVNNTFIKGVLGIDDIEIVYSGEYSAISKNAAEFAQYIANAGCRTISANEFRERCLRWEADPELDGVYLGDAKNNLADAQAFAALNPPTPSSPGSSKKEYDAYFERLVGPKKEKFIQTQFGTKIKKFTYRDIRWMTL